MAAIPTSSSGPSCARRRDRQGPDGLPADLDETVTVAPLDHSDLAGLYS